MDSNNQNDLLNIYNNNNSNPNYLSSANPLASLIPLRSSQMYQSYQQNSNNDEINQFLNNNGYYTKFF